MIRLADSGKRKKFESGAIREVFNGKGRFDLMPLNIADKIIRDYKLRENNPEPLHEPLEQISNFMRSGEITYLYDAIFTFTIINYANVYEMLLDLSKHFEEGCLKYSDVDESGKVSPNMMKGIPLHCYIDSAVRHLIKFEAKWEDEPHDRAFIWNIMMACWNIENMPHLNDINYNTYAGKGV